MTPLLIPIGTVSGKQRFANYWIAVADSATTTTPGGYQFYEGITDIIVDSSGNSYIAGYSNATTIGICALLKYDSFGKIIWKKDFTDNGTTQSYINKMQIDTSNNLYFSGLTTPSGKSKLHQTAIKVNSSGTVLWNKAIGDNVTEYNHFHTRTSDIDSSGNSYILTSGRYYPPADPNASYPVIGYHKFDTNGNLQIQKSITYSGYQNSIDNIYVNRSTGESCITGTYQVANFLTAKPLVIKTDSSGNVSWSRFLSVPAGENNYGQTTGGGIDNSGNIYVCGYVTVNNALDHNFVAKFNSSGTLQWQRRITGNFFRGMFVTGAGDIFLTGDTQSPDYTLNLMRYNTSGTLQWQRTFSNLSTGYPGAIFIDGNSDIFIAAQSTSYVANNAIIALKLPGDGSLVGTYGQHTYSVSSYPDSAGSDTWSSGSSVTSSYSLGTFTAAFQPAAEPSFVLTRQNIG